MQVVPGVDRWVEGIKKELSLMVKFDRKGSSLWD